MYEQLSNIEQFHKCVGVVLNRLYENFPTPIDIDSIYLEGKQTHKSNRLLKNFDDEMKAWSELGYEAQNNPIKSEMILYAHTIQYLRDEKFLRTGALKHGTDQRVFPNCVLTSKGLTALGKIDVKQKVNLGLLLHSVIRDGKYKALKDIVLKVLSPS